MPKNAFISYSHIDESALERLHKHLAMLRRESALNAWTDHQIVPGDRLDDEVKHNLNRSEIFIALVSPDYLASNYCYEKEFQYALSLYKSDKIRIVPVILETCDWLSSPFKDFLVLPKDGKPISTWTNQNNAYLDVVNGLRRTIESSRPATRAQSIVSEITSRRPRIKRDFDTIQKAEFADKTFEIIKSYFQTSCDELNGIEDTIRAKFEEMNKTAFTCTIVNRSKMRGGEAHITFHNSKGRHHFGDINYVYQRYAETNTSNGAVHVEADEYNLFLTLGAFYHGEGKDKKYSPEQIAEVMWNDFVKQAGIEYE